MHVTESDPTEQVTSLPSVSATGWIVQPDGIGIVSVASGEELPWLVTARSIVAPDAGLVSTWSSPKPLDSARSTAGGETTTSLDVCKPLTSM